MNADRERILALCSSDELDDATAVAYKTGDPVAMLLVSIHDTGSLSRFELLLETEPDLATRVALEGVRRNDTEEAITELAYVALAGYGEQLALTSSQASDLTEWMTNGDLVPTHATQVLEWIACHQRGHALRFARSHVEAAPAGSLGPLEIAAVKLLGASDTREDHAALLAYADRQVRANQYDSHGVVVSHLMTLRMADLQEFISQLGVYAASNQAPGPELVNLFGRFERDQIQAMVEGVPDPIALPWFLNQVLPHLFLSHTEIVTRSLGQPWWPEEAVTWIVTRADWTPHARLLPVMLRAVKERSDSSEARRVRELILEAVQMAPADHAAKGDMPRLGVRTLLSEALSGDLAPEAAELKAALEHVDERLRIAEYKVARWKQPVRAERMARIVALGGNIEDVLSLIDELRALPTRARRHFMLGICPHLVDDVAAQLSEAFADDPVGLAALASSPVGANAMLAKWQGTVELAYFRALASTEHSDSRLAEVPDLVRDYGNDLATAERRELVTALGLTDGRYRVLTRIIGDWARHPQPDPSVIKMALELAEDHLVLGADPDPLIDAGIVLSSAPVDLRKALYAAVGRARPTPALVAFLAERRDGEAAAGRPAVSDAIAATTAKLEAEAATDDPHRAASAVTQLDMLAPVVALPVARWLSRAAPLADQRITAIRILGEHGNREADAGLLRAIAQGDEADGDPRVRGEATRALRRLEIGDLAAAHEKLAELAGLDSDTWTDVDPQVLYGSWAETLRQVLDRIAKAETDENWAYGIDQLDEAGKILLYRALETAGVEHGRLKGLVKKAQSRDPKYGSVVNAQALAETWPWVAFFAALHAKRTAHANQAGSSAPAPKQTEADFDAMKVAFRDGAGPCLQVIAAHTPAALDR